MHLEQVMAVYEAPMVLGESVLLTELPECQYACLVLDAVHTAVTQHPQGSAPEHRG